MWDPKERLILGWERNLHYVLEAPQLGSQGFSCPKCVFYLLSSRIYWKESFQRIYWRRIFNFTFVCQEQEGLPNSALGGARPRRIPAVEWWVSPGLTTQLIFHTPRIIHDFIFDSLQQGVNLPDYVSEGGMATKNERWTRRKSFQIVFFYSFHNYHNNETFLVSWASGHFCLVVGSPPDYDYDARFPHFLSDFPSPMVEEDEAEVEEVVKRRRQANCFSSRSSLPDSVSVLQLLPPQPPPNQRQSPWYHAQAL